MATGRRGMPRPAPAHEPHRTIPATARSRPGPGPGMEQPRAHRPGRLRRPARGTPGPGPTARRPALAGLLPRDRPRPAAPTSCRAPLSSGGSPRAIGCGVRSRRALGVPWTWTRRGWRYTTTGANRSRTGCCGPRSVRGARPRTGRTSSIWNSTERCPNPYPSTPGPSGGAGSPPRRTPRSLDRPGHPATRGLARPGPRTGVPTGPPGPPRRRGVRVGRPVHHRRAEPLSGPG